MAFFALFFLIFPLKLHAQDIGTGFLDGVKAYQEHNYEKAKSIFTPLVDSHPENSVLLYNLGLSEYQLGHSGLALGLWRKARYLEPSMTAANSAILYTEELLFPEQNSNSVFQTIYKALTSVPLAIWILLSFFSFFSFAWFAIENGIKRKKAFFEWPPWLFITIPLFLFSTIFLTILLSEELQLKATIIEKNLLTHTTPSETSPTLAELQEGQIVTIEKSVGEWIQIRTLRGVPGWVPQKSVIQFGGSL